MKTRSGMWPFRQGETCWHPPASTGRSDYGTRIRAIAGFFGDMRERCIPLHFRPTDGCLPRVGWTRWSGFGMCKPEPAEALKAMVDSSPRSLFLQPVIGLPPRVLITQLFFGTSTAVKDECWRDIAIGFERSPFPPLESWSHPLVKTRQSGSGLLFPGRARYCWATRIKSFMLPSHQMESFWLRRRVTTPPGFGKWLPA